MFADYSQIEVDTKTSLGEDLIRLTRIPSCKAVKSVNYLEGEHKVKIIYHLVEGEFKLIKVLKKDKG